MLDFRHDSSSAAPADQIQTKEFVEGALKAGSLFSMLENKKLNAAGLFTLILEKKEYREIFVEMTASENFKEAILSMLYLHPSLVKSKITKTAIKKLNAKPNNKSRATSLQ
jgi:hypothetical protein